MINRRRLAANIFNNWLNSSEFIDHLFEETVERNHLESSDRNWLQSSIYSCIEHYYYLNHVLEKITKGKFHKNKPVIKSILLLAANELIFMKTANYAIVNEYVKMVKDYKLQFFAKIVNGILRQIARDEKKIREEFEALTDLHLRFNLNKDLVEVLLKNFSEDLIFSWLNNKEKRLWARKKILSESTDAFFKIDDFNSVRADLEQGNISIQDRSAGILIEYLDLKKNMAVLDYCSAPGGKSCYIAERCSDELSIIATDENTSRLKLVEENIDRLGLKSIQVQEKSQVKGLFDLVLVDIPCSGLGVLKKRVDLSIKCDLKRFAELHLLQREILNEASGFVNIGANFAITTCTILPSENEELVTWFLSEHPNFVVEKESLKLLPFENEYDGAFISILKRIK
jgi:16S rRNA (cytosine967-C5)-methyltransferase